MHSDAIVMGLLDKIDAYTNTPAETKQQDGTLAILVDLILLMQLKGLLNDKDLKKLIAPHYDYDEDKFIA